MARFLALGRDRGAYDPPSRVFGNFLETVHPRRTNFFFQLLKFGSASFGTIDICPFTSYSYLHFIPFLPYFFFIKEKDHTKTGPGSIPQAKRDIFSFSPKNNSPRSFQKVTPGVRNITRKYWVTKIFTAPVKGTLNFADWS